MIIAPLLLSYYNRKSGDRKDKKWNEKVTLFGKYISMSGALNCIVKIFQLLGVLTNI